MSVMASQVTGVSIVCSVGSDADQRRHQISTSLAFVWGIHRWPMNSPHKMPVTPKMFPFDNVIMDIDEFICTCHVKKEALSGRLRGRHVASIIVRTKRPKWSDTLENTFISSRSLLIDCFSPRLVLHVIVGHRVLLAPHCGSFIRANDLACCRPLHCSCATTVICYRPSPPAIKIMIHLQSAIRYTFLEGYVSAASV